MKKSITGNADTSVHNLISQGTTIKGDIETSGDLRIDGALIGNIITKGKLVVGDSASIEGTIKCENADISGKVVAKVSVNNIIVLKESSRFSGDIITKKISIEPGAVFTGNCQMASDNSSGFANKKDVKEKR
jgi:cytoskeletal protein CcmA (bactofilin family)